MVNMANSVKAMCAVAIILAIRQKRKEKDKKTSVLGQQASSSTLTLAAIFIINHAH